MSNSFEMKGWYWKLFTICLLCFPCGSLFCWSAVWALCFLTHEILRLFQFQKQPSPSEKTCLPVLCKSSCSHIVLCQKTDFEFAPADYFIHQFYPLTQQAKNPAGISEMYIKKSLYCSAAPGRTYSFEGCDGTCFLCITFILAGFPMLKKYFHNCSFPTFISRIQANCHNFM